MEEEASTKIKLRVTYSLCSNIDTTTHDASVYVINENFFESSLGINAYIAVMEKSAYPFACR